MTLLGVCYRVGQRLRNDGILYAGLELGATVAAVTIYTTVMTAALVAAAVVGPLVAVGAWIAELSEYGEGRSP